MNFSNQYCNIISNIMKNGIEETNTRTGMKVKALPGVTLQVDLSKEFPLLTAREIRVENFVAEMIWFLSGSKDTNDFLNKHTKIWDSFTEMDGSIETAYGYRWKKHFGRDQIQELLELLIKDPSNRQAVVVTWDPRSDGLLGKPKKNVPCPYTFTVNIIGGKLHLHNIIRSNDMILGCPTDAAGFALLALILAEFLGVEPGIYTHSISNAHIYENHYEAARELVRRSLSVEGLQPVDTFWTPCFMYETIQNGNKEQLFQQLVDAIKIEYHPLPAITGLVISL